MPFCTRFNPSANGGLHLGHAFTALVNEAVAHASGGRFVVRFEDTADSLKHLGRERIDTIVAGQRADLCWLGLEVDAWQRQSEIIDQVHDILLGRGIDPQPEHNPTDTPELLIAGNPVLYPYTPTLTAEKVVMDWLDHVNLLIRGVDLMTEFSLYTHYCHLFGIPQPWHIYLPRLQGPAGDISKTNGGYTLAELRADGWTPDQIRERLGRACLRNHMNGWTLHNLKPEPRL